MLHCRDIGFSKIGNGRDQTIHVRISTAWMASTTTTTLIHVRQMLTFLWCVVRITADGESSVSNDEYVADEVAIA